MAQIDQALIDLAVSHGYTEKQARDYYANQASDDNSAVSSAAKQGQQNIANQDKALAKLPEPDLKGAIALAPAVGNIVKSNAETTAKSAISSATNMFQNLDASDVIQGALEAAGTYGVYKTLKNKMTNNSSSTSTIPTTPAVPTNPANPATNAPSPSASATPATPAPSGIANLQQRLGLVPAAPAPALSPEEVRQQKLNAAGSAAQQEMKAVTPISAEGATPLVPAAPAPTDTPPIKPVEPPVAPPSIPPSASPTPTPEVAIVNNQTGATPADKAVAIVNAPETPVPPPKAPRAERGSLATIANNPAPVEGMPGMRENYTKPKGINPVTGEPFIGSGGYNWLHNNLGPERAPIAYEEQYGKRNVPYKQVEADYSATRYPPTRETIQAKSGGDFGKPKYIPEYIKGAATPAALATTAVAAALPALGVAAYRKYQGNEAAVNASLQDAKDSLQSLATMPYDVSKAALNGNFKPLKDLMLSMNPGSLLFNEMDKHDEAIIKNMIQKEKVGAGRGLQGVPPPTR